MSMGQGRKPPRLSGAYRSDAQRLRGNNIEGVAQCLLPGSELWERSVTFLHVWWVTLSLP